METISSIRYNAIYYKTWDLCIKTDMIRMKLIMITNELNCFCLCQSFLMLAEKISQNCRFGDFRPPWRNTLLFKTSKSNTQPKTVHWNALLVLLCTVEVQCSADLATCCRLKGRPRPAEERRWREGSRGGEAWGEAASSWSKKTQKKNKY